jgi:glycosyltransferase involved in cell wall biosynthesis
VFEKVMQPLVTVLMPVYNAEAFLREAIESILQQTLTNFEFLIIDDGSTDNSVSIIKSYNDDRIRFVQNEQNCGISATLNLGIELATCELIARMDADDISYPERLQKQYDFIQNNKEVDLLSTWAREVTESGAPIRSEKWRRPFFYYNLTFECWIYHPTVMYKRSAVLDVGAYSTPYSEDYDLWWQLSRKYKIDNLPEVLLDYRLTTESLYRATKKTEYEIAQYNQIVRNLQYYTGQGFHFTHAEVECYRHNFGPLLNENSISAMVKAVQKLDHINYRILQQENVNRDVQAITEAAYYKKRFIIGGLLSKLPKREKLALLVCLRAWRRMYDTLRKTVFHR